MAGPVPMREGCFYHVYSRGANRATIFYEERNYRYFLRLAAKYLPPVAETYAYCLLPNHFHFLVRVRDATAVAASRQVGTLLNAYAKAINNVYRRTGGLFRRPFGRIEVGTPEYLSRLVTYIHQNPERHGIVDDFRSWTYSSYAAMLSGKPTALAREAVLEWFGGRCALSERHLVHEVLVVDGATEGFG
ncbi:MAG: transposase [Anaerolineae bacterium]